ncbi:MAG: hypothetical protein ACP5T2_02160 [Thermoprotei archaeon]
MKKIVIFDTSFLINSLRSRRDLIASIEECVGPFLGVVPSAVVEELKKMPKEVGGPALITASNFSIYPCAGNYADGCILHLTDKKGWVLATDDLPLSRQARIWGIPVISHSGRKLRFSPVDR